MKNWIILLLTLGLAHAAAFSQSIKAYEYFFDADPGVGKAIRVELAPTDSLAASFNISLNGLSAGLHKIGIRYQDLGGSWTLIESRTFEVSAISTPAIRAAEYFTGSIDPGAGRGIPLVLPSSGDSITLSLDQMPKDTAFGYFLITLRFQDESGSWSLGETNMYRLCSTYGADAAFTYQVEGNKVFFTSTSNYTDTLKWDFGDGIADTNKIPVKTYQQKGNFTVKLAAANACGRDTATQTVTFKGLQYLNPATISDSGQVTVLFKGSGLTGATQVRLQNGSGSLLPTSYTVKNDETIEAIFLLNNAAAGKYDAVSINGTSDTLKEAITIDAGLTPTIEFALEAPSSIRTGRAKPVSKIINKTGADIFLLPIVSFIALPPENFIPITMTPTSSRVFLESSGIFKEGYDFFASRGLASLFTSSSYIDTTYNLSVCAYMKVNIKANQTVNEVVQINNTAPGKYTYNSIIGVPLFYNTSTDPNSRTTLNLQSPFRDCLSLNLRNAITHVSGSNINLPAWTTSFNNAFDDVNRQLRDVVAATDLSEQVIAMPTILATLLAKQVASCNCGIYIPTTEQMNHVVIEATTSWYYMTVDGVYGCDGLQNSTTPPLRNEPKPAEPALPSCNSAAEGSASITRQMIVRINGQNESFTREAAVRSGGNFPKFNITIASDQSHSVCEGSSFDPNDIYGPGDNKLKKYINSVNDVSYRIAFENVAAATAPAAQVTIIDTIDKSKFDISTLQLSKLEWGDSVVIIESNRSNFSLLKNLQPAHPNILRVDVATDTSKGIITWNFYTLDPVTGNLTDSPFEGFLPPNTDGIKGTGSVSYSIKPISKIQEGASLFNQASIIFDDNAPINTPVWEYRIDTTRPVTSLKPLPLVSPVPQIKVEIIKTDLLSGISSVDIWVSVNDSAYRFWKSTGQIEETYTGEPGKTYKFITLAADNAGNEKLLPANALQNPEAVTTISNVALPVRLIAFRANETSDKKVLLSWEFAADDKHQKTVVERSSNGSQFNVLAEMNTSGAGTHSFNWLDAQPLPTNYYRLKFIDRDGKFSWSNITKITLGSPSLGVGPNPVKGRLYIDGLKGTEMLTITDISGKTLFSGKVRGLSTSVDMSSFTTGLYILRIVGDSGERILKIVKDR